MTEIQAEAVSQTSGSDSEGLCSKCRKAPAQKDGLCPPCRMRGFAEIHRQYPPPSPELIEQLRAVYAGNVWHIHAKLHKLSKQSGRSVGALRQMARRYGIRSQRRRKAWTEEELEYLRHAYRAASIAAMAVKLGRCDSSVREKLQSLGLNVRDGYSISELARVFGVSWARVKSWAEKGFLGERGWAARGVRFSDAIVVRFIREHSMEYDLTRVDEGWWKGMIFGSLAEVDTGRGRQSAIEREEE